MGAKRNAVTGLITQLIIIALGLIVPRIMITNYGSDTNGLTNTLTRFLAILLCLKLELDSQREMHCISQSQRMIEMGFARYFRFQESTIGKLQNTMRPLL